MATVSPPPGAAAVSGARARLSEMCARRRASRSGASSVAGVTVGGLGIDADRVRGLALAGARMHTSALQGVSVSAWNDVRGPQRGIAIGLFNYAREIHGVQVGVLNYVRSNPKGLRLLPLFNTRFSGGR